MKKSIIIMIIMCNVMLKPVMCSWERTYLAYEIGFDLFGMIVPIVVDFLKC